MSIPVGPVGGVAYRSDLTRSFGQPEEHNKCAVEPDDICICDTTNTIANVASRHRRDLVDHDPAWLLDPGRGCGLQCDPGQWRIDRVRRERAHRDRGGCVEAIVLDDHDRSGLPGVFASSCGDVDISPPHSADSGSAGQSMEMASTNAWSSDSCSLAAIAADWRCASATNSGARTSGTQI